MEEAGTRRSDRARKPTAKVRENSEDINSKTRSNSSGRRGKDVLVLPESSQHAKEDKADNNVATAAAVPGPSHERDKMATGYSEVIVGDERESKILPRSTLPVEATDKLRARREAKTGGNQEKRRKDPVPLEEAAGRRRGRRSVKPAEAMAAAIDVNPTPAEPLPIAASKRGRPIAVAGVQEDQGIKRRRKGQAAEEDHSNDPTQPYLPADAEPGIRIRMYISDKY